MAKIIFIVAMLSVTAPAIADSRTASPDARVRETRSGLVKAKRSGDAATIADARAKLQAASAVAWGVRHPAAQPEIRRR
jgi:hypothetical protein